MEGVDNLIYGEERIDIKKQIYCVEGPLDSLFLPNCLAIAGLNFKGCLIGMVCQLFLFIPQIKSWFDCL
jgi:hypothetical protein